MKKVCRRCAVKNSCMKATRKKVRMVKTNMPEWKGKKGIQRCPSCGNVLTDGSKCIDCQNGEKGNNNPLLNQGR